MDEKTKPTTEAEQADKSVTPETEGQNDAWPGEKLRKAGEGFTDKDGKTIIPLVR